MNPEDRQPLALRAEERSPHQTPAYGYTIQHPDGTYQFLTGLDRPIRVSNLPAAWGAADPQTFTPTQIKHGTVTASDRHEPRHVTIYADSADTRLRRFLVTAAPTKIRMWIIRFNAEAILEDATVDYTTHAQIIESGVLGKFGFSGLTIAAELTPDVFFQGGEIPRFFFSRRCNHPLFSTGCGLAKASFAFDSEIVSLDPVQREMVILGRKAAVDADYFSTGHLLVDDLGMHFSIGWSEHTGASNTKLKLTTWHPEFTVGQTLTAYAGCRHTVADCTRLGNVANFGGFPHIPTKNPTLNGT